MIIQILQLQFDFVLKILDILELFHLFYDQLMLLIVLIEVRQQLHEYEVQLNNLDEYLICVQSATPKFQYINIYFNNSFIYFTCASKTLPTRHFC